MKRTEVFLAMGDSITVDGVTFTALQPFTARIEVPRGSRLRTTVAIPDFGDEDYDTDDTGASD